MLKKRQSQQAEPALPQQHTPAAHSHATNLPHSSAEGCPDVPSEQGIRTQPASQLVYEMRQDACQSKNGQDLPSASTPAQLSKSSIEVASAQRRVISEVSQAPTPEEEQCSEPHSDSSLHKASEGKVPSRLQHFTPTNETKHPGSTIGNETNSKAPPSAEIKGEALLDKSCADASIHPQKILRNEDSSERRRYKRAKLCPAQEKADISDVPAFSSVASQQDPEQKKDVDSQKDPPRANQDSQDAPSASNADDLYRSLNCNGAVQPPASLEEVENDGCPQSCGDPICQDHPSAESKSEETKHGNALHSEGPCEARDAINPDDTERGRQTTEFEGDSARQEAGIGRHERHTHQRRKQDLPNDSRERERVQHRHMVPSRRDSTFGRCERMSSTTV